MDFEEISKLQRKYWIIKKIFTIYEIFRWFNDIGFRRRAFPCWMKTWENRFALFFFMFEFIALLGGIIGFSLKIIVENFSGYFGIAILSFFKEISSLLLITGVIFFIVGVSFGIFFIRIFEKLYKLGEEQIQKYGEYRADLDHHGIILPIYSTKKKNSDYDLIPLFINGFYGKIPYKIYPVKNERDFLRVYYDNKVRYLWILGHGDRGGFSYNKRKINYLKYSDRFPQKAKKFIAQLHCNCDKGQTLAELNGLNVDYDTTHVRWAFQNSFYIMRKVEEFLQDCEGDGTRCG